MTSLSPTGTTAGSSGGGKKNGSLQATTVPSDFSARPFRELRERAVTSVSPAGTVLFPHPTTLPSDLTAALWYGPAAMATTSLSPGGTLFSSALFGPQATTVPSARSARVWV